jgi:hypothetical protein
VLCIVWQQFSAAVSAPNCGMNQCISAGASVSRASRNSNAMPSIVIVWPVAVISSVGAISVTLPAEVVIPSPAPICPLGSAGSRFPYMYDARRLITFPASTFSATAASRNPTGATILTLPACTSASSTSPLTPPKWSTWLCENTTATTGLRGRCA